MQKTKLGITVGALACAVYLAGIFNSTILILLAGYVLIAETNPWLKRVTVKAVMIVFLAYALVYATDFINDVLSIPNYIIRWFDDDYDAFQLKIPLNLLSIFDQCVYILEFVLLALCALKAPKQGTFRFAPIDKLVDKIVVRDEQ